MSVPATMATLNSFCPPPIGWLLWTLLALEFGLAGAVAGHEIVVVEKGPNGLFVGTSEHDYAFTHPDLLELTWSSVSVRGNLVLISRRDNATIVKEWTKLAESSRDFISDLRSDFIANLAGLRLTHAPPPPPPPPVAKRPVKVHHHLPPLKSLRHRKSQVSAASALAPTTKTSKSLLPASGGKFRKKATKKPQASKEQHNNCDDHDHDHEDDDISYRQTSAGSFNYFNVNQFELKTKLTGDVLHFDMSGNVLDIFSSTLSVNLGEQRPRRRYNGRPQQGRRTSTIYRDESFFSFSSGALPLDIHRLFVQGGFAFFVYRNSRVLAKAVHSLSVEEKKMLNKVRAHLRELCHWQSRPLSFAFALPKMLALNADQEAKKLPAANTNSSLFTDSTEQDA